MTVEIIDRLFLLSVEEGGLPPYWNDKPLAIGLNKAFTVGLQIACGMNKGVIDGTSISNALGKNLDDIGYLFNVSRQGLNDDEYRNIILLKMSAYSDSGTTTDVLRYVLSAIGATDADITTYPDTRFGTLYTEGVLITTDTADSINKKASSGSRLQTTWDIGGQSFMPSLLVTTAPPEPLQAITGLGNEDVEVQLDAGILDILGYVVEDAREYFPYGRDRATLSLGKQGMTIITDTDGEAIELITDGGIVPIEALLDNTVGGRYFSCLPVVKQ